LGGKIFKPQKLKLCCQKVFGRNLRKLEIFLIGFCRLLRTTMKTSSIISPSYPIFQRPTSEAKVDTRFPGLERRFPVPTPSCKFPQLLSFISVGPDKLLNTFTWPKQSLLLEAQLIRNGWSKLSVL